MIRLALAQINQTVGDLDGNVRRIVAALERARTAGADLVALPELAVLGYPPEDLLLRADFVGDGLDALERVLPATRGLVAVIGFVDREDPANGPPVLFNAAAVAVDGRHVGTYHKRRLPNYGVFDEKRYFTPGRRVPVFAFDGLTLGVTICEDIWFPGGPPALAAAAGAGLLVNINASPYHAGKWREREAMLRERARAYGAVVAYVNLVGGQDELVFDGASVVIGPDGAVLARGRQFAEDLVLVDIAPPVAAGRRIGEDRRPTLFPEMTPALRGTDAARAARLSVAEDDDRLPVSPVALAGVVLGGRPRGPLPACLAEPYGPVEEVYRALALGLRDYMAKNGFRDVVVGLSGGIDSALVTTIATDALGPEHVHAVFMPSPYTSEQSRQLARDLAARLGIGLLDIGIDGIFAAFLEALAPVFAGRAPDVAEENIQARIRGTLLMALSNKFGWLLLATGNKSEYSVGYATLYGDMAGGFALLKDVPKTLVYALARWRNQTAEVIPAAIIDRPPTAELRAGQLDTDTLPPYDVLDPILRLYVEEDAPAEQIVAAGHDPGVVARVLRMVDRSEYKRRQAPPGVKITPKAFGRDRRLPITNAYLPSTVPPPAAGC